MNQTLSRVNEDADVRPGPITVLRTQLEQRAAEFRMALPSHITPEKFQRTVLTAVQTNPDLLLCDRRSLLTACMKSAHDGCLPDGREAAIVPFNTRMKVGGQWQSVKLAQYMPMVAGLRKKILQSEEVVDIYAAVVFKQELESERFIHREGTEHKLYHAPIYDLDFRPKDEDIALAYSVATFANGYLSYEVMRRYEIDEVRQTSQTGAEFDTKGEPRDAKGPWVDWFAEMAKKTVIRRHSKSLPQSSDVVVDVEADDMAYASRSALALLETTKPDLPTPIEPVAENGTFDDETGEVEETQPKPEAKPKPTQLPAEPEPKGKPEPTQLPAEPQPEPEEEPGALADDGDFDELGITKTDEERKAEELVSRAKACDLLTDFRKLEREAEMDLAEMPVHLSAIVDTVFEETRKRLTPRKRD